MQPIQPPPGKAGLFAMPSSEKEPRKLVLRRPVCYAVNLSRAAQRQPFPTRNHARRSIPHAIKAPPVEELAPGQYSVAQYDTTQTRRNGSMQREPTPDRPVHAAPGRLCKFAKNRAVKALQIRPISTTRDTLQELHAAISNGLAAFGQRWAMQHKAFQTARQELTPSEYARLA